MRVMVYYASNFFGRGALGEGDHKLVGACLADLEQASGTTTRVLLLSLQRCLESCPNMQSRIAVKEQTNSKLR
jgi:hypothetical protein